MFNLPNDSYIDGKKLFHEGNHDSRGLPHDQYLEKSVRRRLMTLTTNKNKYALIGSVTYVKNTNMQLYYNIDVKEMNYRANHTLELRLYNDTTKNDIKHTGNHRIKFYGVNTDVKDEFGNDCCKFDIYALCTDDYNTFVFRVNYATNLVWLNYDYQYAYRQIELYTPSTFLDSLTPSVTESVDRPDLITTFSTTDTSVAGGGQTRFFNIITDITNRNVSIELTLISDLGTNFTYSSYVDSAGKVVIMLRNHSATAQGTGNLNWRLRYKLLE